MRFEEIMRPRDDCGCRPPDIAGVGKRELVIAAFAAGGKAQRENKRERYSARCSTKYRGHIYLSVIRKARISTAFIGLSIQ